MHDTLRTLRVGLCLAAFWSAGAAAAEETPGPATADIDAIFAEWDRTHSPGCSLGVYRDGEIAYARGYGMANLEHGIANSPRTVFRIGSTSKQFTAMAVALAAERGELALDDDIRKLLSEMPSYGEPVTVRHLVHHTSGLRDYLGLQWLADRGEDYSVSEALAIIARQRALNFAPGEQFLYSNSNYFLMSQLVERATGQTLRAWTEEHLLRPLGMRHTHFHDDHTHIVRQRANGYSPAEDGGFRTDMTILDMVGDGGIYTTVEDLLLWDNNFYDNRLGKGGPGLIELVETPAELDDGEETPYGFGLFVGEHRGVRMISHGGAFVGYRAAMNRFPDHRLTVAVLCNLGSINPEPLARGVAELYLGDALEPEAEAAADGEVPAAAGAEVATADLERVSGWYWWAQVSAARQLLVRDGRLVYSRGGGHDTELAPQGGDRFLMVDVGARVEVRFEPAGGKPERMLVDSGNETPTVFEAFEQAAPSAQQLGALAGRFHSEELDHDFVLELEDGALVLRRRGEDIELAPLFADAFSGDGLVLRFERGADGHPTAFLLDAGRVRGLRFARR